MEEISYEEKVKKLEEIIVRLDNSETSIDNLTDDVKLGAKLIKDLNSKLKQVEMEVTDVFKELEGEIEGETETSE